MTHARDALLPVRPRTTRGGSPPPVAALHPEQRVRISQPLAVGAPHPPMEARHPATRSNREAFTRDESLILLKGPIDGFQIADNYVQAESEIMKFPDF